MISTKAKAPHLAVCSAVCLIALGCGRGGAQDVSGRWQVTHLEWEQNDQRVRLSAEGELQMGRFKLPTRPASFEPMIAAMQHVSVEVNQTGRELNGRVHADANAPASILEQVGARPGSVIAEFAGELVSDTLGSVTVVTPDGRRREVVLEIEDGGERVVARAVPVFGEAKSDASDVVLVRFGG